VKIMKREKQHVRILDAVTGEILGEADLSVTRLRALLKAYAAAGIEAVAA
jgi:hypothetical protein